MRAVLLLGVLVLVACESREECERRARLEAANPDPNTQAGFDLLQCEGIGTDEFRVKACRDAYVRVACKDR